MTVIVGLEASVNDNKAVVIGSDRLCVNGELLIVESIRHIATDPVYSLSSCFRFIQERGLDKVKLKFGRKIQISEENKAILAHTGETNQAHEQVSGLLLNPKKFLEQDSLLFELMLPLGSPKDIRQEFLESYKCTFNLDLRLLTRFIPEVKRIFDIHIAKRRELDFEFFKIAYFDRNYHPVLSEYLYTKLFDGSPKLFDIACTGAVTPRQYYAKGCGAKNALKYLRRRLGTTEVTYLYPAESQIERKVSLTEAIDIVKGAIEHTNEREEFCKGMDYVIFMRDGIEPHFSDEEKTYEIDLPSLINRRIKTLRDETQQLRNIKREYNKKT